MLKVEKGSIEELGQKVLKKAGSSFFTAIIDDEHYYDEKLRKQTFENGRLYYPSILVSALHMADDTTGESIMYKKDGDTGHRFTLYKNISYVMTLLKDEHVNLENPIQCIAEYDHYEDLPAWMQLDHLAKKLYQVKDHKEYELSDILEDRWERERMIVYKETLSTAIVLFMQYFLFIPYILNHPFYMRMLYYLITLLILIRFIGRAIKIRLEIRKNRRDSEKKKKNDDRGK